MFAFSFDLYDDGEFVTNVVIHATDRVSAWAGLDTYTAARSIGYDAAIIRGSRAID